VTFNATNPGAVGVIFNGAVSGNQNPENG